MNLFIALCNGRIDISNIVKTQEIILTNLTNTVVQNIVMAYSHICYGYVREGGGGDVVCGEGKHYFLLTKFCKKLYVQNIFCGDIR